MRRRSSSNSSAAAEIEMPRSCSSAIQSDVALRRSRRPRTAPASSIAPAYSSSFSVSVVLPASGWEMMANVRRRATSCSSSLRAAESVESRDEVTCSLYRWKGSSPLDIFLYGNMIGVVPRATVTSDIFNAVAESRRRDILDYLASGERHVTDVVEALGLPQPSV